MSDAALPHPIHPVTLYCFNPWHDEALASASPHYQPPLAARRLAADLALLPAWWATPGDAVAVLTNTNATTGKTSTTIENSVAAIEKTGTTLVFSGADSVPAGVGSVAPWGWDALLVRRLGELGVAEELLPPPGRLAAIRAASSRLTAVRLLRAMRDEESCFAGRSEWCTDLEAVRRAVEALPHTMLKAPWSGSGRGLRQGFGRLDEALAGWVRRVLSRQGGLSVEPFLTKRCDLALEFEAHPGGQWDYMGPSVFVTDATGRYAGSLVAPDDVLLHAIGRQVDLRLVDEARRLVEQLLPRLAEGYTGPVGVDMMVVEGKRSEAALHPCVEVNLRRTMGRVALDLRRHLAAGLTARFVLARPQSGAPAPVWRGDRLAGGSLPLVPVGATTSVAAYLDVADGSRGNWSAMM